MTRAVTVRWLSFGFLAAFLLASSARAGTFGNPFMTDDICGTPDVVDSLANSYSFFASSAHCSALCKKTVSECKKFEGEITSCYSSWYANAAAFENRNCAERQPASAVRACKAGVAADLKAIKAGIASTRSQNFANCEGWGGACQSSCPQ
jgi:hypothetical protein